MIGHIRWLDRRRPLCMHCYLRGNWLLGQHKLPTDRHRFSYRRCYRHRRCHHRRGVGYIPRWDRTTLSYTGHNRLGTIRDLHRDRSTTHDPLWHISPAGRRLWAAFSIDTASINTPLTVTTGDCVRALHTDTRARFIAGTQQPAKLKNDDKM